MLYYYQEWLYFVRTSEALVGIPFCLAGVMLVLLGWRMWKMVAFLSFALVGAAVGQIYSGMTPINWQFVGGGAALFGVASLVLPTMSSTFLGGLIGAIGASVLLDDVGLVGPTKSICLLLAAIGAGAWAFANRHRIIVTISSFEGAVLLVSGLAMMLAESRFLYHFFHSMIASSNFMLVFFLLVPTVVGITLQVADSNRNSSKPAAA